MRKVQSIFTSTISVLFILTWCSFSQAALVEKEAVKHVKENGPGFFRDKYERKQYFWEKNQATGQFLKMSPDGHTYSVYSEHGVLQARYENGVCTSKSGSIYSENDMDNINVGTIGTEDRHLLTFAEKQIPAYKRVGIVVGPSGEEGTGMVFGESCEYVLTAAHVTWKTSGSRETKKYVEKSPSSGFIFSNDPSGRGRISKGSVVYNGWRDQNSMSHRNDFAIIKLNPPALSSSQCERLGELRVKKWNPSNHKRVNCEGHLSMVAMNNEDPASLRLVRQFKGREPGTTKFVRVKESFQSDGDSNNMTSGAPVWCHENGDLKLTGITKAQKGYNPENYNIDSNIGKNPGFGKYDKENRFTYHISIWSNMETQLSKYGGEQSSIIFED